MFDIIRKQEYFDCLTKGHASALDHTLKGIQDGWVNAQLGGVTGKRILEVGGGHSRALARLSGNQLWNVDKFEGEGQGPKEIDDIDGVTVIRAFLGEFDPRIPEVDIVFSISVIEHIPVEGLDAAFADMARILAPGGVMYHAIDLPLNDAPMPFAQQRIEALSHAVEAAGLKWVCAPVIRGDTVFESTMASNSDLSMWQWTKICDKTKITAPLNQIVSLKLIATK